MIHHAKPNEYLAVGIVGLFLFAVVLITALTILRLGILSRITQVCFASLAVMAILEFPRYGEMISSRRYDSAVTYSIHILAGNFFFLAFSILCQQWASLLKIGTYAKMFYGRNGIFVANVVFFVVDIISISLCMTSPSLDAYFKSPVFTTLSCIEAVKNFTYTAVLSYNGLQLIDKLWKYSQGERHHTSVWRELYQCGVCCMSTRHDIAHALTPTSSSVVNPRTAGFEAVLLNAIMRLVFVLLISMCCFLLRIAMLVVKIVALNTNAPVTTQAFTLFGFVWIFLSDFIPRVLPSLAFMYLMRTKRPRATREPDAGATSRDRAHSESSDQIVLLQIAERDSLSESVVTV